MPEPVTDFKQPSVAIDPGEPVLSPNQQADRSNGGEMSLAQFATEISEVLKNSGIGVHSSLLMELLGSSAIADPAPPPTPSSEILKTEIAHAISPAITNPAVAANQASVA